MTTAMARPEDTVRGLRLYRTETDDEEMESGTPDPSDSFPQNSQQEDSPGPDKNESQTGFALGEAPASASKHPAGPKPLTPEETIELARTAVESGIQDTKRSLAGSEAVTDVVKPKLTIDLGHSNIIRIPEPVVDLIKDEVERLSLSNNQIFHIPYRFAECSHLRYLNIRANNFREFPKGVYKLPLLEILDLSRNKIKELPNEISKLKSLRVLSMMQNRLNDLPVGLSEMHKLQIFKCAGNPLRQPFRDILEETENEMTPSGMTDNEKEVAATTKLKRYFMKSRQTVTTPEPEVHTDASDGSFEAKPIPTPIPSKRNLSGRFPVIPSTGDSSAASSRSPSISRPPIPAKSHFRMASGQQGATYHMPGLQRPPITPYSVSERNRSNSEGIIQGSSAARSKRMGLITRKNTDLGTLDETRPYRNSHLRGLSHGSVLRPRQPPAPIATTENHSQSPSSPRERRRPREGWVNRMSSLPEHKGERGSDHPIIRSAKGILFALFQVHSHIDTLINVIKLEDTRRHSLELVFYNATSHVDQLNDVLEKASSSLLNDPESIPSVKETVKRECETCIAAYIHVGTQLRNSASKIVSNGDPHYVRSLMLMIYGSLVEVRNACAILKAPLQFSSKSTSATKRLIGPSNPLPPVPDRPQPSLVTPTRDPVPPSRRMRSDTTIRHPQYPMTMTTSTPSGTSSPGFSTPYSRSRSSSRSNLHSASIPHALATPRSGESFPPIPLSGAPRVNTLTGLDENEEERIFERIFHQLISTHTAAHKALPLVRRQLIRCLEVAQQSRDSEGLQLLWNNLIRRAQVCQEVSDALGQRLSNMKVKEPGGGLRNQREFWQLCKSFMQSFVDLVNEMREVRNMQLLPSDVVILLRPVQKASREAGRLIEVSPWAYLADPDRHPPPGSIYGPPLQAPHMQHQTSASASAIINPHYHNGSMTPQSITVPATPPECSAWSGCAGYCAIHSGKRI
ncbi:uncharacterized protein N7506_009140 [Penicillium brevicompactum]|uniref:uncharacterized protein n=1 Tax=Penicillium brevicompactum TaxID=5074 RepID=UPI00254132CE|nr:uncharacterized protein N7506_009140 [Penicillium brevicompactum]KAJ5326038.1 hypothetical protein N7506_009140 [Penicillium brevicompactum]